MLDTLRKWPTKWPGNPVGLKTLYQKEVQRFFKVIMQTLLAPVITTLLFMAVFMLALDRGAVEMVPGLMFSEFLAPGLIMMAIVQNAFANSSSSLIIGKVNGNIVDILLPPLAPSEYTTAFVLGGVTRGLLVGLCVGICMALFVSVSLKHPIMTIYYAFSGATMLAMMGILAGIWANKFDHLASITNFIITPLSFLSGTFYSISSLPTFWQWVAYFNPFFYMIDGLRFAMTGYSDGNVYVGTLVLLVVNVLLWWSCVRLFRSGYKLRS